MENNQIGCPICKDLVGVQKRENCEVPKGVSRDEMFLTLSNFNTVSVFN